MLCPCHAKICLSMGVGPDGWRIASKTEVGTEAEFMWDLNIMAMRACVQDLISATVPPRHQWCEVVLRLSAGQLVFLLGDHRGGSRMILRELA
jgi:hypothetical protein